jgi:hypothetical protein
MAGSLSNSQPGRGNSAAARPIASVKHKGQGRAYPGGAQGPFPLAGADAGPHHGQQRPANAEHQRHQQVFKPRRRAVARNGRRPEGAGKRGGNADAQVGGNGGHGRHQPHAQDVAETAASAAAHGPMTAA